MTKNGTFFISIVDNNKKRGGIWDPFYYRSLDRNENLGNYMKIDTIQIKRKSPFLPIEYRDIPKGKYLSFPLQISQEGFVSSSHIASEEALLFGTLRAYLGNVIVTPKADWLGIRSPLFFPYKSEFVRLIPKDDNYYYFWWAYLRTSGFLSNLSLGSGDTRPRLHKESLLLTPVAVPEHNVRKIIHQKLMQCAEIEWREFIRKKDILAVLDKTNSVAAHFEGGIR
jgi:hypothetical protein